MMDSNPVLKKGGIGTGLSQVLLFLVGQLYHSFQLLIAHSAI
jgi:hypothetical protein